MSRFALSPEALEDLQEMWVWLAEIKVEPAAADRMWEAIEAACEGLARGSLLGHLRLDLAPDPEYRFHCVRGVYLVVYRHGTNPCKYCESCTVHGMPSRS